MSRWRYWRLWLLHGMSSALLKTLLNIAWRGADSRLNLPPRCWSCDDKGAHIISWLARSPRETVGALWTRTSPLPSWSNRSNHWLCILGVVASPTRGPRSTSLPRRTLLACGTWLALGNTRRYLSTLSAIHHSSQFVSCLHHFIPLGN